MPARSNHSLNKLCSKLIKKYPNGIWTTSYCYGYTQVAGNLLTNSEVTEAVRLFNTLPEKVAREKFKAIVRDNDNYRAWVESKADKLIDNWFDGLKRSHQHRLQKAKSQATEKKRQQANKKRQEAYFRKITRERERANREIEEKIKKDKEKAQKNKKAKQAILKKLRITEDQWKLLQQLSELDG